MVYGCAFLAAFAMAGLAYFDRKEKRRRHSTFLLALVFSFPGWGFLAHHALLPQAVLTQAVRDPEEGELIRAVRDYDPVTLAKLRDVIREEALKGRPLADIVKMLSMVIFKNRAVYYQKGSDIHVFELAKVYLEEIKILKEKDPKLCYEMLFKPKEVDQQALRKAEREYLPKELEKRVRAQFILLIQSAYQLEAPPPSREEATPAFQSALKKIKMKHGDEGVKLLKNPTLDENDPVKSIEVFITLFESIIEQPLYESGPALRLSLAQGK